MDIHVEDIEYFYNNTSPSKNINVNVKPGNENKKKIEDIPENNFAVNVVKQKKHVNFNEVAPLPVPMKQTIPKSYAKINRPIQPQPKTQITYDDILSNMGMYVANGKLHLKGNSQTNSQVNQIEDVRQGQNSYIYNKYFKDALNNEQQPQRPRTILEYRDMLVRDIIQKAKIKQIKSKKLIMPNSNINVATGNRDLNKLFRFSQS